MYKSEKEENMKKGEWKKIMDITTWMNIKDNIR